AVGEAHVKSDAVDPQLGERGLRDLALVSLLGAYDLALGADQVLRRRRHDHAHVADFQIRAHRSRSAAASCRMNLVAAAGVNCLPPSTLNVRPSRATSSAIHVPPETYCWAFGLKASWPTGARTTRANAGFFELP